MVVETRYAAGDGVLLGAGDHWVLVTDPAGRRRPGRDLGRDLGRARRAMRSITEQVLAIVEKAFGGEPPGLAIVDLTNGGSTSISRGHGHVRVLGRRPASCPSTAAPTRTPCRGRAAWPAASSPHPGPRSSRSPIGAAPPPAHRSSPPATGGRAADRRHPRLDPRRHRPRRAAASTPASGRAGPRARHRLPERHDRARPGLRRAHLRGHATPPSSRPPPASPTSRSTTTTDPPSTDPRSPRTCGTAPTTRCWP